MSTVGLRQNSWSESFAKYGYHFYAPARLAGHYFEKMTRPDDQCSVLFRVAYLGGSVIFSLLSIPAFFLATPSLFMSKCLHKDPNLVVVKAEYKEAQDEKLSILFLNTACQSGPFPAITAGMVSAYEQFNENYASREKAIVEFAKNTGANILCFSEVHDYSSMKALECLLEEQDFTYFIEHIPNHPTCVNSGLFVASKKPFVLSKEGSPEIHFELYPHKIRSGVHYGAQQGCLTFNVKTDQKVVKIASTHLNFGSSEKNHISRMTQLRDYVFSKIPEGQTAILGGDFNYEYGKNLQELRCLAGNHEVDSLLPEGVKTTRVTFKDDDKTRSKDVIEHRHIRGKTKNFEVIDAAILINGEKEEWEAREVEPQIDGKYVTDHFGVLVKQK